MKLRRRLYRICLVRFIAFRVLVDQNWLISVLNHLVNHKNTQLKSSFKQSYFWSFGSSLQSHPLWVTLQFPTFSYVFTEQIRGVFNKFCEKKIKILLQTSQPCSFFFQSSLYPSRFSSSSGLYLSNFLFLCLFPQVVQLLTSLHGNVFNIIQEKKDTGDARYTKDSCLKLSKYKADAFDIMQNALEVNNRCR